MRKIALIIVVALCSGFSPDECDIKELNYLMDKIEYKAKCNDLDKALIREWLCKNENIDCL